MRRLEVERIRWSAGANSVGWVGAGDAALGASNSARQPPSMTKGASPRSGVAPARRASHARLPGGSGHRPDGYYGPPARSSLTVEVQALAAKRGPMPVLISREVRAIATSGAPRGERVARRAAAQAAVWMRLPALRSPRWGVTKRASPVPESLSVRAATHFARRFLRSGCLCPLVPANAGTQRKKNWMTACAGMSGERLNAMREASCKRRLKPFAPAGSPDNRRSGAPAAAPHG
jgi:hypothetical protein